MSLAVTKYLGDYDRARSPTSLVKSNYWNRNRDWDWFDEEWYRNRSLLDSYKYKTYDPLTRWRPYDTIFTNFDDVAPARFVENRADNTLECHIPTGVHYDSFLAPEDVEVNIRGRDIEVKARKEVNEGGMYKMKEFKKAVRLPDSVNAGLVTADLTKYTGTLIVKAPLLRPYRSSNYSTYTPIYRRDYGNTLPVRVNRKW